MNRLKLYMNRNEITNGIEKLLENNIITQTIRVKDKSDTQVKLVETDKFFNMLKNKMIR